MKRIDARCAGSYYFDEHPYWIANIHKNGKFFYGIRTEDCYCKKEIYIDMGFRVCRKETK